VSQGVTDFSDLFADLPGSPPGPGRGSNARCDRCKQFCRALFPVRTGPYGEIEEMVCQKCDQRRRRVLAGDS
jgi:hypothetical protein